MMNTGMKIEMNKRVLITIFTTMMILLSGCAKPLPGAYIVQPGEMPKRIDPKEVNVANQAIYKITPLDALLIQVQMDKQANQTPLFDKGNQMRIGFVADNEDQADYKLVPGDELSLEFPDEEEGSYVVLVNPDGRIALPKTGASLQVSGITLAELNQLSVKKYRGIFLKPKLAWAITKPFNQRLETMSDDYVVGADGNLVVQGLGIFNVLGQSAEQISEKITQAATAKFKNKVKASVSMYEAVVRPQLDTRVGLSGIEIYNNIEAMPTRVGDDGDIFVPTLGNLQAKGKTIAELRNEIKSKLQPKYQNPIHVNVSVTEYAQNNIFIGGEVMRPGRYPYSNKLSLLKIIATAGWGNLDADLSNVILLRANAQDGYTMYRTNLTEVIEGKASGLQDFMISPQDLVIVPPTSIAKQNRFVTQYIRGILPFGTNVIYGFNNNLNNSAN